MSAHTKSSFNDMTIKQLFIYRRVVIGEERRMEVEIEIDTRGYCIHCEKKVQLDGSCGCGCK